MSRKQYVINHCIAKLLTFPSAWNNLSCFKEYVEQFSENQFSGLIVPLWPRNIYDDVLQACVTEKYKTTICRCQTRKERNLNGICDYSTIPRTNCGDLKLKEYKALPIHDPLARDNSKRAIEVTFNVVVM